MLVPKSELNQLLGVASTVTKKSQGTPAPTQFLTDIRFELARALPALWHKAQMDKSGQPIREKDKLRDLIQWFLTKKNATIKQRYAIAYMQEGQTTNGRIDLVADIKGTPSVAIEVDWAYSKASLEKLLAAHHQDMHVLWVCGAQLDKFAAKKLRTRANAELGPTYGWLFMFHLEHGWI